MNWHDVQKSDRFCKAPSSFFAAQRERIALKLKVGSASLKPFTMNKEIVVLIAETLKTQSYIIALATASLSEKQLEDFFLKQSSSINVCLDNLAKNHPYLYDAVQNHIS